MNRKDLEAAVGKVVEFTYSGRRYGTSNIGVLKSVEVKKTGYRTSETKVTIEEHFDNGNPPVVQTWIKGANVRLVVKENGVPVVPSDEYFANRQRRQAEAIERQRVLKEQESKDTIKALHLLSKHGVEVESYYVRYGKIELTVAQVITALTNKEQAS